ncbi:MAG TPA: hypothetical protein VLI69_00475 [Gammaproteobacteria bacterium]|nr:hypothetical protein [Gammaproteobacteria bacterium]
MIKVCLSGLSLSLLSLPDQTITCNNALVTPLNIAESNQAFGIVALLSQAKMEKLINQSVEKMESDNHPLKRQRK